MFRHCLVAVTVLGLVACSGTEARDGFGSSETRPLLGDGAAPADFSRFVDEATGFTTDAVYDADRETVHFDAALGAMVSAASGDAVSGWTANGNDLRWSRSGVPFRVRFGTEAGERRAYFTEAGPGTICDLRLLGPDQLFISGTPETPPNP